jgi:GNAT superfamily N-acetyltransferase
MHALALAPFTSADRDACLAAFDSNVPKYFLPNERAEYASFLDAPAGEYFVVRREGEVVGCGGVARRADEGNLCWGIVHASLHRHGIGSVMIRHRLEIARRWRLDRVRIHTSQHTEEFFARAGFLRAACEKDGFGPGLDRVTMLIVLR